MKVRLLITLFFFCFTFAALPIDTIEAARHHPKNDLIPVKNVPQFILLSFDDNGIVDKQGKGALTWMYSFFKDLKNPTTNSPENRTFDGSAIRATLFMSGNYATQDGIETVINIRKMWHLLSRNSYEIGNHGMNHLTRLITDSSKTYRSENINSSQYNSSDWIQTEISQCQSILTDTFQKRSLLGGIGINRNQLKGWRTPRLEWNDALFTALLHEGYLYDCSIEMDTKGDGTSFWWPFTLHNGAPSHWDITDHPGLWEIPVTPFVIPEYLRKTNADSITTGFDYRIWANKEYGGLEHSSENLTQILIYTLNQHIKGNRAPMQIVLHSEIYSSLRDDEYKSAGSVKERQKAIEIFIEYAIKTYPEIRFVTHSQLIDWMKDPVGLK